MGFDHRICSKHDLLSIKYFVNINKMKWYELVTIDIVSSTSVGRILTLHIALLCCPSIVFFFFFSLLQTISVFITGCCLHCSNGVFVLCVHTQVVWASPILEGTTRCPSTVRTCSRLQAHRLWHHDFYQPSISTLMVKLSGHQTVNLGTNQNQHQTIVGMQQQTVANKTIYV